ncbi:MAG: hypothetical protein ACTS3F_01305 [Phycisphaerales bacterium]
MHADRRNILLSDHLTPDRSVLDIAESIAAEIIHILDAGQSEVEVDLGGMRGVPSSFFNLLLLRIGERFGAAAIDRIKFGFRSPLQERVYQRSLHAVRASLQPRHAG